MDIDNYYFQYSPTYVPDTFNWVRDASRNNIIHNRPKENMSARFNKLKKDYDKEIIAHQKLVKKYNELLEEYRRHLNPSADHKCKRQKCTCMCHLHDTFYEITW